MPKEREAVLELPNSWIEKGMEKGMEKGIELGAREEREAVVVQLLGRKIGVLSKKTAARIARLSMARLSDLTIALLDFTSAKQLEEWLGRAEKRRK